MIISDRSTLLFIGDSITDCGRDPTGNPTPWNLNTGLGRGYVEQVASHFGAVHPARALRVINRGISGHTVRDLEARWTNDVIAAKPEQRLNLHHACPVRDATTCSRFSEGL